MKGQLESMQNDFIEEETPRKRLPLLSERDAVKSRITVTSEYDRYDELDLLHGYMILRGAKNFQGVSERYANALAHKVNKAGLSATKANELSHSTQTGFGDEWVPDLWSAQIWDKARVDNVILSLFRSVEMPSNPVRVTHRRGRPECLLCAGDERRIAFVAGEW